MFLDDVRNLRANAVMIIGVLSFAGLVWCVRACVRACVGCVWVRVRRARSQTGPHTPHARAPHAVRMSQACLPRGLRRYHSEKMFGDAPAKPARASRPGAAPGMQKMKKEIVDIEQAMTSILANHQVSREGDGR